MKYPSFSEEKKLWGRGFKAIAGLDEAGRGSLAGPVLAAAVVVEKGFKDSLGVKDSKKLTAKQREEIHGLLIKHPQIKWGIGRISEKVIDRINILEATKLAMQKALKSLGRKVDYLILDGSFKIKTKIPQKSIIKADVKVFSCAAASIIAKVSRDRIMDGYHKKYPKYNFKKHKGYPTLSHRKTIKRIGPCPLHRKTFAIS